MRLEYRDGLLFTIIEITYKGVSKTIDNMVLDTGATKTMVSQEIVNDIGIKVSKDDAIVMSYGIGGKDIAFIKK